jgi:hypothetical protein
MALFSLIAAVPVHYSLVICSLHFIHVLKQFGSCAFGYLSPGAEAWDGWCQLTAWAPVAVLSLWRSWSSFPSFVAPPLSSCYAFVSLATNIIGYYSWFVKDAFWAVFNMPKILCLIFHVSSGLWQAVLTILFLIWCSYAFFCVSNPMVEACTDDFLASQIALLRVMYKLFFC